MSDKEYSDSSDEISDEVEQQEEKEQEQGNEMWNPDQELDDGWETRSQERLQNLMIYGGKNKTNGQIVTMMMKKYE